MTEQALAHPNTDAKEKGKQKEKQRVGDSEHDPAHEAKEDDANENSEDESEVWIPGAVKAVGLIPAHEFLLPVSYIFHQKHFLMFVGVTLLSRGPGENTIHQSDDSKTMYVLFILLK